LSRYLHDVELRPSDTIIVTQAADNKDLVLNLTLDKLQLKDAGLIKVKAENLLGDVSSTANLTVKGKFCLVINLYGQ